MTDIKILADTWSDNMELDRLNAALQLNSSSTGTAQAADPQRFWATPERDADDDGQDTMEITFSGEKLINHISLDLVKFPHVAELEYYNTDDKEWQHLKKAGQKKDESCIYWVDDCIPAVLPPMSNIDGHHHPQHSFSGHWQSWEFECKPVRCQKIRVLMRRNDKKKGPCNSRGKRMAYSLAVRNFYCGYKVYSQECIPTPQPKLESYTDHQEFSTSTDVLGSQVSYSYRVNRAANILFNSQEAAAQGDTLVWKCEPQPFANAVVNYFMDVRDGDGEPQVLDRFFIDPLYDGPNCNLYFSNDEPEADFPAPTAPLPPQIVVVNSDPVTPNVVIPPAPASDPLGAENVPVGQKVWVDVDNTPLSFKPGRKWWLGMRLNWRFLSATDTADHPIFDCGAFSLAWTQYGLRFAAKDEDWSHMKVENFDPATDFTFCVWYVNGRIRMMANVNGRAYNNAKELSVPLNDKTVPKLRIGGFLDKDLSSDFRLRNMMLKVDVDIDDDLALDFLKDPTPYCVKPEFPAPTQQPETVPDKTDNAILRYNPGYVTTDFPTGLVGGTPTKYSNMEWSPISRDYVLRKGFLQFPPTKAKYWKFEFCGLVPEAYEVYVPIKKTVKTYRTEMWQVPVYPPTLSAKISVMVPGLSVSASISASFGYSTSISAQINFSASVEVRGYSATCARVAKSAKVCAQLTAVSWTWGFQNCHKPTYVPRFETKCVHTYDEIDVEQTSKTAYFVGLKAVQPYRVSYIATDDTAQYEELFHDKANIDADSGWTLLEEHALSSGEARYAEARSKVFPSNRVVRAVQFATTQSAPMQLLPDDDFDADNPSTNWRAVGDGTLAPETTRDERVGSICRVDRSTRTPYWSDLESFGVWGGFEATSATWGSIQAAGNQAQSMGGVESKVGVATPPGGRIYAAARVIAPADLSEPLFVQIIDDETGRVLSESSAAVKAGAVTEFYTGYTVGEGGQVQAWRWSDFSSNPIYPTYVDNFVRANATTLGTLLSGQPWLTTGTGHALNTNEAVTTVAGQYDYVDSLTPWGTFEMVVGTMAGTGQALAPLFELGPIRIDDQGVPTYNGGRSALPTSSVFGRALVVGDDVRIDVMPMAQVPSNRRPAGWTDNVTLPYALVVYLNNTWVGTLGHRLGSRTRRGFLGRLNQRFRSFSWTPGPYGALPGPVVVRLPVNGTGSFDAARLTWTDPEGYIWAATGSIDNTSVAATLIFTATGSRIVTDTGYWYGTLTAGVRHVATGADAVRHGNVLVLDADTGVYLDQAGNVMKDGVSFGNLVPGGVTDNSVLQVQFLATASVAASVRGSIDPTTYPRMLRALVNGTQVGVLAFAALNTWQGLRRGVAGDAYNGTATGTGVDQHASFDSFGWAPDSSNVVLDPKNPTWDEVSQRGTGTYDSLARYRTLNTGRLRARLVQRGSSIDVWDVDTLSLYADPVVWSFSNDGGATFYPVYDIRNDPNGVFMFPDAAQLTPSAKPPGHSLVWRVISYAPHQKVSSLTIRPWYGGLLSGITHRVGLATGGPNSMPYDHYPPIEQDARFQAWHKPIPQDWFYTFRALSKTVDDVVPMPKVLLASETLVSKYKDEVN